MKRVAAAAAAVVVVVVVVVDCVAAALRSEVLAAWRSVKRRLCHICRILCLVFRIFHFFL